MIPKKIDFDDIKKLMISHEWTKIDAKLKMLEESVRKCIENGHEPKAIWFDYTSDTFYTVTRDDDYSGSMMLIAKFK
jgi:hypothetical protein